MSVNEILNFNAQLLFIALSANALIDYIRRPNPRRRDFALFCWALGLPLAATLVHKIVGVEYALLNLLGAFALFAQPYFLLRLLHYYRPTRRWMHVAVLAGMVFCWIILFLYIGVYPLTTQAIIFGYTVLVYAYCTWEYSRGMRASTGTLRRRLTLITISAGLFTLALAGNVVNALVPNVSYVGAVGLAVTAISAVLYYLAFIPPRWIRQAWHFEELRDFLAQTNLTDATTARVAENTQYLAIAANQAVNGLLGAVVRHNETNAQWEIQSATDRPFAAHALANCDFALQEAWQQRKSIAIYTTDIQEVEKRRQLEQVGARTWLFVPVATAERMWGILLVIVRERALFIEDNLALLELFAQQSAMVQESNRLFAELEGYSHQLEAMVEERTRALSESETALRELNATLEERVEQRTAELQRSNEELDNFAYVASHDLKSPLRAIQHLANWIEQDAGDLLPAVSREHLAKLQGRVRRMENLLNDLLAYSRVGRQRARAEAVNLEELVQDVTEMVAPPPGFEVKINGNLPVIQIERPPLETIFRNLISNAIKHHHRSENGRVEIWAETYPDFVEFAVKDDGPGIAPEYHQRVFDIFTTLHPRDQIEGSGIGLAIARKSVESRGGKIWLESDVGLGTTVRFTWPQNGQAARA